MKKQKILSYEEYVKENVLPDWSKPTSDLNYIVRKKNFQKYQDKNQSMIRFNIGDTVIEIKTGIKGIITSMGDGMNTITWKTLSGERRDSKPEELQKIDKI